MYALLTMEWVLIARSYKCVHMHAQHVYWRSDSFIYYFVTLKGNQTGDKANYLWHVYSNPENPKICPVLAMDKYFFSHPKILTTNSKLFPGNHQYEIFLNIFHKIINDNLKELQSLGVDKGMLGSHSFRK